MKNQLKWWVPALAAVSMNAAAAPLVVDLFGGTQGVADATNGGSFVFAPEYGPDNDVLGLYRDLGVNCISSCVDNADPIPDQGSSMLVANGKLNFNNDSEVIGQGTVVWDGQGTGVGATGLAADLTAAGTLTAFQVVTEFSDSGLAGPLSLWTFDIFALDQSGNSTNVSLVASSVDVSLGNSPLTSLIPFAAFSDCAYVPFSDPTVASITCVGGGADLTDLDLLSVTFNTGGTPNGLVKAIDLTLLDVNRVPAPSALALMGLGLLAAGAIRRKRQAA